MLSPLIWRPTLLCSRAAFYGLRNRRAVQRRRFRRTVPGPREKSAPRWLTALCCCVQALYSSASAAERQRAALAAARDAQVRAASVRTDLALELPPTVALPEEHPLAGSVRLRDADQEQELYGACVRAPPNRTVRDGSPPCGGGRLRRVVVRSNSVTPCNRTARWHSPDCQRPGGV